MDLNEYRVVVGNLKRALKERRLTYREVADGIGLSESGIKKIFLARDGSFQRLAQICQYAGLSLGELLEDRRTVTVGFTDDQQKSFLKDPNLFRFYWMLVYERRSISQVQEFFGLNKAESFRMARKLDNLKLLKLLPGDRLRLPSIKAVRWVGDGEFLRKLYREWSHTLVDAVAKPEPGDGEVFMVRYLPMIPETYAEFTAALRGLEEEFVRRSIHEMRTQPSKTRHVRLLMASDNRSFVTGERSR